MTDDQLDLLLYVASLIQENLQNTEKKRRLAFLVTTVVNDREVQELRERYHG